MVKICMLCKNLLVQLEIVKILNPATLLWVDSGPPDMTV
jgi:hypothetical protein